MNTTKRALRVGRTPDAGRRAFRGKGLAVGVSVMAAVALLAVPVGRGPTSPAAAEDADAGPAAAEDAGAEPAGQPSTRPEPRVRSGDAVPDEVIVKWAPEASARQRADARRAEGLSRDTALDLVDAEVATFPSERGEAGEVADRVARDERVAYAEPNLVVTAQADPPDDPEFDQLWGLHNIGQTVAGDTGTAGVDIDALEAWDTTRGDADVTVAVLDTGTDIDHPDLEGNVWTNPDEALDGTDTDGNGYVDDLHGWDFFHDDATVFDPGESDSHGTHVAGTIAATAGNATGVAGAAPGVSVMPLKFLGPLGEGDLGDAITALDYAAAHDAEVVNASWGGVGFSQALRDAIEASGMVFVTAAGNQGADNDTDPVYPCNHDLARVLCVTAVDNAGGLADFSNTGADSVDVGAPGVSVLSTVPRAPRAPVALQIADPDTGAGYEAMFWGFGLEEAVGAANRAQLLDRALGDHLGVAAGDSLLLVDDDESDSGRWPDTRPYYTEALEQAGYHNVKPREVTTDQSGPTAAQMQGNTVVWFTGYAFGHPDGPTTLTDQDQAELIKFLEGGGELVLAGDDAIYRIDRSTLVTEYLHANFEGEVTGHHAEGGPDSVYAGQDYDLTGLESPFELPSPYLDHVEPASSGAVEALVFPALPYHEAYEYFDGTSMAAPYASGAAALVASHAPTRGPGAVVDALRASVDELASLDGATVTGGMVNAANALVEAAPDPPGAPTDVTAEAGDEQATVSWQPPDDDGGSPITAYTVVSEPGGVEVTVDGDQTQATVAGLANGTTYTFTVHAVNEAGPGPASAPSNAVTPAPGVTPPGAPTAVAAVAGDEQATVSWQPPDDDGGGEITAYTITSEPGGLTVTVDGDQTEVTVVGLANGTPYEFRVTAVNEAGAGPASEASDPVTPGDETACELDRVPPAGFTDVAEGNVHGQAIDCVVWYEVARGTTATTYAPEASVRRDQMASFVARALDGSDATLPEAEGNGFTDLAGNLHADNIGRLAEAGIVQGVTADRYAPAATVTRAQMASFLARAYAFAAGELPVTDTAFTDIAGNTHEDNIRRVAGAGIARGTTATTYSPFDPVRRDQMASFLARTLDALAEEGRLTPR